MSDLPEKPRGSQPYLPPPPDTHDDFPDSVHFPRMQPPPASLEALMRGGARSPLGGARGSAWLWVLLVATGVAFVAYMLGLHR